MKFLLRLTAFPYEQRDGFISTKVSLRHAPPSATVEVESGNNFAAADAEIEKFGKAHAPADVWYDCRSPRKPAGFKDWSKTRRLFPAPEVTA